MPGNLLLTFNTGSSSLKIGVFEPMAGLARAIGKASIDFDRAPATLTSMIDANRREKELAGDDDQNLDQLLGETLDYLMHHLPGDIGSAAHRVVHGGLSFKGPVVLDDGTIDRIEALVPLAPLHQPKALRVIHAMRKLRADIEQTASFDTAFHATQDDLVRRLAIPRAMHDEGVRRYGFHGLSYRSIVVKLKNISSELANGRVVVAHLGSGASLCALKGGESRDTSMGFSALDGIPMATRPGSLDPGAMIHLMKQGMRQPERLEQFLYHECGLLGVSGVSGDTRVLLEDHRPEAAEALDLFCLRIAGEIGRLCSTLGGLDAIVFTAGIGENQPEIRSRVAQRLKWLGVELDEKANAANATAIGSMAARIEILVIPTDEEQVIADEAIFVLHRRPGQGEAN